MMSYKTLGCDCPVCGKHLDGATTVDDFGEEIKPEKGDLSICKYCTSFLEFIDNHNLKELTNNEVAELPHEIKMKLLKMRKYFGKNK